MTRLNYGELGIFDEKWQYSQTICVKNVSRMKLPKARKRGDAYSISISYDKKRYYCTRDTAKECEQWAASKLLELKAQTKIESGELKPKYLFRDLNTKYYQDVGQFNKSKSSREWIQWSV